MTDEVYEVDQSRIVVGIIEMKSPENAGMMDDGAKTVSVAKRKAQTASRTGRVLLKRLLREEFGIDLSDEVEPIGREDGGKPFLRNHEGVFFNISHSKEYVACAVGDVPMGIDIQYHKTANISKMARRILSETEWESFEGADEGAKMFYHFWAKKESFLKFTGEGIRRELIKLAYEGCRFLELNFEEGYSGMVCVPEEWDGEILVKRWWG